MRDIRLAVALLAIAALAACAAPPSTDSSELAATTETFESAFNAGDVDGIVNLYHENARLLAPNAEMRQGHTAVRADFESMITAGLKIEFENVEVSVLGDLGQKIGLYTVIAPDGSAVEKGKFVELWKRIDGRWQITGDIWNSDLPAGPQGELLAITHEVEDLEKWMAAWSGPDSRHEDFAANGAPHVKVVQNPENPNHLGLVVHVTDMAAFQAWVSSPEGQGMATEDSVKVPTMKYYLGVE
jgi:ketosteroid isomerase-like protein